MKQAPNSGKIKAPETGFILYLDAGNPGATYLWSTGDVTQQVQIWGEQLYYPGLDSVWVTVSYGSCSVTDVKYIWLDVCEGIENVKNENDKAMMETKIIVINCLGLYRIA